VDTRLDQQINFLVEIDKLKQILRQTYLIDGSRQENDAEHSWHLAMMAMVLHEYVPEKVDLCRVIQMVLVHDLVEIYAGDTFAYDAKAHEDKEKREQEAAGKLFSILPSKQGEKLRGLWEEFEAQDTPEAKFATALDRLQPLMHNYYNQGGTWKTHNVRKDKVMQRIEPIAEGAPVLAEYARHLVEESVKKGYLAE